MASRIKQLRQDAEERGDLVGHLLPADWIELKGNFTSKELEVILTAVKDNFVKVNGNKKRHIN